MKKLSLFLFVALFALVSCSEKDIDNPDIVVPAGETLVDVSLNILSATRAVPDEDELKEGTAAENTLNTLDLLVFKDGKFHYRRYGIKSGSLNTFRATLKVETGLDVHFLANSRTLVEKLIADGTIWDDADKANKPDLTWDQLRAYLIDEDPERFVDDASTSNADNRANLPMWGSVENVGVTENTISHWNATLLRAVAGVDIYVSDDVVDEGVFELSAAYLYFAPDQGILAPSAANLAAGKSESAPGMAVKTAPLGPATASTDQAIQSKLYLFDNDTDPTTYNGTTKAYTRVVLEGKYDGVTYYYPLDFVEKDAVTGKNDYDQIVRNTKYVFVITSVEGPGYPDPETASKEKPIYINADIYEWDIKYPNVWHDGTYYISISKKKAEVGPTAGSVDIIDVETNAKPDEITLSFAPKVDENGDPLLDGNGDPVTNGDMERFTDPVTGVEGIRNDRFEVIPIIDDKGNVTGIKFEALGDYSTTDPEMNKDVVVVQIGNIEFEIPIFQTDGGKNWNKGDDINTGVGK